MERVIKPYEKEYDMLKLLASMLTAMSPNGIRYEVRDVYFDFGQNWMWTTICTDDCQVLNPREWSDLLMCDTIEDVLNVYNEVVNGKYFSDKVVK